MQAFIAQTAQDFGASRAAVQAVTAASLWLMQLNAPDAFARVHQTDPFIRVLVESAPTALAQVRSTQYLSKPRCSTAVPLGGAVPRRARLSAVAGEPANRPPALQSSLPQSRRTDHALLRLFAAHGFSLHLACRFTQLLFDTLSHTVGTETMTAIQRQCATLDLLLLERRLSQAPRRIPAPSLAPVSALGSVG